MVRGRAVVDVLFDASGSFPLQHLTPGRTYGIGMFEVTAGMAGTTVAKSSKRYE